MSQQEIDSLIRNCRTQAELRDRVSNLVQEEKARILQLAVQQLDRSDAGYNRVLNRIMALAQEEGVQPRL